MKKWLSGALLASTVALTPLAQAAGTVVIDMGRVLKSMPQSEQLQPMLQKEFADRMQEIQGLEKELNELVQQQQRDAALMSEQQKTELKRKFEELESSYQLKIKAFKQDSQRRQREEQNKLLVMVQKAVTEIQKSEGYDLVIARQAVVFATPEVDISEKVIAHLSK